MIRWIAILACALTVAVTAASAFIRHAQAGVGCSPWPSCYREASPVDANGALDEAPRAVIVVRALHRVIAVAVGLLALGLVLFGWSAFDRAERIAASFAIADVVALSWLGRFTPHDLPLVTIGNVVGGFALAAAFGWIAARSTRSPAIAVRGDAALATLATVAIALLALLAVAGVMIASRHVVDACAAPLCFAGARFDAAALDPLQASPGIDAAAALAMHALHRIGALLFIGLTLALVLRLHRRASHAAAVVLAGLSGMQALAGLATAFGAAPLVAGVVHNAVAATLAIVLAAVIRRLGAPRAVSPHVVASGRIA